MLRSFFAVLTLAMLLTGCDSEPSKPAAQAEQKPAVPAIPEEYESAAKSLLGSDAQILLFGDLANTGKPQILAANVLPNTPKSTVAGTVVTRAVVAEKDGEKWVELFRADEHLKNAKGFLGLTPLQAVTSWKLQYEDSPEKGMFLYFTPVQAGATGHTLPIGVSWNPGTKRYQSMDPTYTHFLLEAPSLENSRSSVR
jgi:hypothetical protein